MLLILLYDVGGASSSTAQVSHHSNLGPVGPAGLASLGEPKAVTKA